jgi:PEP-CTERM motif-containing protein
MKIRAAFWVALACLPAAFATPITYTISTTAGGTFNGTPFSDNTIMFTQVTDTSLLTSCFGTDICSPATASNSVTIQGFGTFTVNDMTIYFNNPTNGVAGFNDAGIDALTENDAAFTTYNMQTALGPIFDTVNASSFKGMSTTGGMLTFTGNSLDATFQAVLGTSSAPEPGSLGLMLAGALVVGFKIARKI